MIAEKLGSFFTVRAAPDIIAVYLFGSEAEGRSHAESDADVGVLADRTAHATAEARSMLKLELAAELIPVTGRNRVDVVMLNDAPPELGRRIVVTGQS